MPKMEEINAKTTLFQWVPILNFIDESLDTLTNQYKESFAHSMIAETTSQILAIQAQISLLLDFSALLLRKSRTRNLYNSTEFLLKIIQLDDWILVTKAIRALIALFDISTGYQIESYDKKTKEIDEWLLNIAFGYNLKSDKKYTFLEVLQSNSLANNELFFQYITPGRDPPIVTIIRQTIPKSDTRTSEEIAKDISDKNNIPQEHFNALWCKVRLARTATNPEIKEKAVIASLIAYIAFVSGTNDHVLASSFVATEPRVNLIPSVIQLLKEKLSSEIHCAAFELLTALLTVEHNSYIELDLFPAVINQISILSPSGLIQGILQDIVSVQLIPLVSPNEFGQKFKAITTPEIIPRSSAENSKFIMSLFNFLMQFERNIVRGHSTFLSGLINAFCNFLHQPVEGHYVYHVPVINKAMTLLYQFLRHNLEDYSATDSIIKRLSEEIGNLTHPEKQIFYAVHEFDDPELYNTAPKLEHRQELCKSLYKLLSSSIHMSVQRNPALQNALNNNRAAEMQQSLDQQRRAARARRQRVGPQQQNAAPPEQEQEEQAEQQPEEAKDESIVVSRRVLESNLIELCKDIFHFVSKNVSKACDSVSYYALVLIASVIRDIPTCIPDLISKGLIPAIVNCYYARIPAEENYLRDILRGINAIVLHHDGCAMINDMKIVYPILQTLLKDEYNMSVGYAHMDAYEEPARQILSLFSQAELLRSEIIKGTQNFFLGLYKKSEVLIQKLAEALQIEQKTGSTIEKELILEKCNVYSQTLRGILYFTVALIQNEESADHKKFLNGINSDCELVRSVLQLLGGASILGIYVKNIKKTISHFTLILRRYVNDVFSNKENSEIIMRLVSDRINVIENRLKDIKSHENLENLVNCKTKLIIEGEDMVKQFPEKDQLLIFLNHIETTCEIIKILGIPYTDAMSLLEKINEINKLLLREIIRICKSEIGEEAFKININDMNNDILRRDDNFRREENHMFYNMNLSNDYRLQLDQTYQQTRRCFISIMRSAISKRRFEPETDSKFQKIINFIGATVCKNISDVTSHFSLFSNKISKLDQLSHLLYDIMLIEDIKITFLYEGTISQQIQEFVRNNVLTLLFDFYQSTVNRIIATEPENAELNTVLFQIISIFEKLLDPTNIKKQLHVQNNTYTELGFKTQEDYLASYVIHIWETILFHINYGKYKTCIKFLSENNRKTFEIFLNIIKRTCDKKNLSSLLTFDQRNRREPFRYMPLMGRLESMNIPGIRDTRSFMQQLIENSTSPVQRASIREPPPPAEIPEKPSESKEPENIIKTDIKKITAKDFQKEMDNIISNILDSLYAALYSVSSYKCKKLLFNLVSENTENRGNYKIENVFSQLLNELQTLLTSLEISFEPNLVPLEDNAIFPDLVDFTKKNLSGNNEEPLNEQDICIEKIGIIIDVLLTFIKHSKKVNLIKIICDNGISKVFVSALGIIYTKGKLGINKEQVPKILLLLSKIYKELFDNSLKHELQYELLKLGSKTDNVFKIPENNPPMNSKLPDEAEISKLMTLLNKIFTVDETMAKKATDSLSLSNNDKENITIITSETLTLILAMINELAKHHEFSIIIQNSGVLQLILGLKTREHLDKIPIKLFIDTTFHLFESPELLHSYMKRIITSILFSKAETKSDEKSVKSGAGSSKLNIDDLQKKTETDLEDFLEKVQFLSSRSPRIFIKACKSCLELVKKNSSDENNQKYTVILAKDVLNKTVYSKKHKIPEIPLNSQQMHTTGKSIQTPPQPLHKSESHESALISQESKNLAEYKGMLQNSIKDCSNLLNKASSGIFQQLLERLLEVHFEQMSKLESKPTEEKSPKNENEKPINELLISEEILIETIGEMIKVHPELFAYILSFKSAKFNKISGTNIISFFVKSLFPSKYISKNKGEQQVSDNEKWRNHIIMFTKLLTYEAKSLLLSKHRILYAEMRRRVLLELLNVLANNLQEKNIKSLAALFSSVSILEGILSNIEDTLVFPVLNIYRIIRLSLSTPGVNLVKLCMDLLKSLNLNSSQAELLTAKLVKILERVTRFNTQKSKAKEQKEDTNVLMLSDESDSLQNLHINPLVRELAERELEASDEDPHSEDYVENSVEPSGISMGNSEQINEGVEMEEIEGEEYDPLEGVYEESVSEPGEGEEGANEEEISVPMEVEQEGEIPIEGVEEASPSNSESENSEQEVGEEAENQGVQPEGVEEDQVENEENSVEAEEIEIEGSDEVIELSNLRAEDVEAFEEASDESNVIRIMPRERFDYFRQMQEGETGELRMIPYSSRENQHGRYPGRINIDAPPRGQEESRAGRLSEIYERIPEEDLNNQISPFIRVETTGEDDGRDISPQRVMWHMQVMHHDDAPVFISRAEGDRRNQANLASSILGPPADSFLIADLIRKQLTNGVLPVTEKSNKEMELEEEKKVSEAIKKEAEDEKNNEIITSKEEIKKEQPLQEEVKKEEVKKEQPLIPQLSPEALAQRRQELASIVPGVQVEDNLLTTIDFDFLRALPESMRLQAVEPFVTRPRHFGLESGFIPESILTQILREPEESSTRPRNANLLRPARERAEWEMEQEKRESNENLEVYLKHANKGNLREKEIIDIVAGIIKEFDEKYIESILRLLYLNIPIKMPINAFIGNICYTKALTGKILDTLLFILVHHPDYEEKLKSSGSKPPSTISRITLTDSSFPPVCLYNGIEVADMTYYTLPLRIFGLLSHLLKVPFVIRCLLPKDVNKPIHLNSLKSIKKLKKMINVKPKEKLLQPALCELLSLVENKTFRTSTSHTDALIQFIIDLFKHYEEMSIKKSGNDEPIPPLIDSLTVKQICKIFFLDSQTDKACNKLVELLAKLSFAEQNAKTIIEQTGNTIEEICKDMLLEWRQQMKSIEEHKIPKTLPDQGDEEINIEYKFVRLITLLKGLFKGHTKKEEIEEKPFKFVFDEEDSMGEFSPLSKRGSAQPELTEENKYSAEVRKQVLQLYEKPIIGETFDYLTDFMIAISRSSALLGPTIKNQMLFKLVPAIEALIIAYNHIFNDSGKSREIMRQMRDAKVKENFVFTSKMASALYKFLKYNNKTVNNLIRQLEIQSFLSLIKPFIIRFPSFLDFDNKRAYFRNELRKLHKHHTLKVSVNRNNIFVDSYAQLANKSPEDMLGRLRVTFRGEPAVDAGGVTREWYTVLSKAMFNPDICLFKRSAHGNTYQPDPKSIVEPNHISYFHFIGRIIGKALLDGMYLDCFFTRAFYKIIVGQTLNIHDLEDSDMELYNGLAWLRDNDATVLDSTFSYTVDFFGEIQVKELIENGKNVQVTNENKHDFIVRMCKAKLYEEIKPQMEALLSGLYEMIPKKLMSIFDSKEIELLISGLPDIDIFDLKKNTEYHNGYNENTNVIKWLWEILESFSNRERAEFLQFVTGTSKVPLDGFKSLPGAYGIQKFQIHRVHGGAERLPAAHTCFNQLDLPEYPSKEVLQERLTKAVKEGAEYMGLL